MKFRELEVGDTFDWIGPNRQFNSFFDRCVKVSARGYMVAGEDSNERSAMRVGTIDAEVFHVERRKGGPFQRMAPDVLKQLGGA